MHVCIMHTYVHVIYIYIYAQLVELGEGMCRWKVHSRARALSLFDADTGVIAGPICTCVTLHICVYIFVHIYI